ncbi:MAG: hypothetical protein NTW78_07060 [Campylobacterales bacterium]|nr:hypothetical protein [Campylobacterales bacterium]
MKKEANFKVISDYSPAGDQPTAIKELIDSILKGNRYQALEGDTGVNMDKDDAWLTT